VFTYIRQLLRAPWQTGLICSAVLHVVLAVLVGLLLVFLDSPASSLRGQRYEFEADSSQSASQTVTFEALNNSRQAAWMATSSVDLNDLVSSADDPRWQAALLRQSDLAESATAPSEFITDQLLDAISDAEQHTDSDNLDRLETLTGRLNDVSSAESVDQMKATLQRWLGTTARATEPATAMVEGEFDFTTAQLHDVVRVLDASEFRYTAVLLDAAGRTMESPLTQAEGESVYRIMQLMKENPLLERVYRGVVLSFMDQLLKQQN
jgi:hypothetical protein